MIFNTFQDTDIVSGRTTRIASGFWPEGVTNWSQSLLSERLLGFDGFSGYTIASLWSFSLRRATYHVLRQRVSECNRKSKQRPLLLGYLRTHRRQRFIRQRTSSIRANPTKEIYTQYKNLLLGTSDLDGKFSFKTGSASGTTDANDIFVLSFSTYKNERPHR